MPVMPMINPMLWKHFGHSSSSNFSEREHARPFVRARRCLSEQEQSQARLAKAKQVTTRCVVSDSDLTGVRQPTLEMLDRKHTKSSKVKKPQKDVYKGNRSPIDLRRRSWSPEIRRCPIRLASLCTGRSDLRLGWGKTTTLNEPQSRSIRVRRPLTVPVGGAPEVDWCRRSSVGVISVLSYWTVRTAQWSCTRRRRHGSPNSYGSPEPRPITLNHKVSIQGGVVFYFIASSTPTTHMDYWAKFILKNHGQVLEDAHVLPAIRSTIP
ncbi:hypothetical protein Acr_00g0064340 [Actinidia rufa]|uniref:Uncharacterized protein n=1 Tax=Actinidia rufa TaxID=165716 RepID=A0A7J0DPH6_9ERIC|nr:hypothetical protein Acr_00g0064340 [Actinidia rufa]